MQQPMISAVRAVRAFLKRHHKELCLQNLQVDKFVYYFD